MIRMKLKMLILYFSSLSFASCMANEEYSAMFQCSKSLIEPYGICTHINRKGDACEYDTRTQDVKMIKSVGASYYRTDWDISSMTMKGRKELDFSHFNRMLKTTDSVDLKALAIITTTGDYRASDIDYWSYLVTQQVSHFKQVKYWEVINEADICRRWFPHVYANEYKEMLCRGYQAVKQGNGKAQVLFSGLANIEGNFVDSILSAGVNNKFDIMNVHCYSHKKNEPENLIDFFRLVDKKMKKYDMRKPVWMTECGCSTAEGWATEETQAMRLPRIFLISFACGIDKVFWYKSRAREYDPQNKEDFFGLWHKNYTTKPAFYAYQTLTEMCPDKSVRPILRRYGNVYIAQWKRPDGKKVYGLWTSKRKVSIAFSIKERFHCFDINGREVFISDNQVEVSPSILYFVGGRKFKMILNN